MENQDVVTAGHAAGTVHVNMLANLEALLNIFANSFELVVMAIGLILVLAGLLTYQRSIVLNPAALQRAGRRAHVGVILIKVGLIAPALVNWLVAAGRDAALFN
ncbi:hypothetical protein BH11CYA1_BH11CYA1_23820 [soil metagenome]